MWSILGDLLAWLIEHLFLRWTRPKTEVTIAEKQADIVADRTAPDAMSKLLDGKF